LNNIQDNPWTILYYTKLPSNASSSLDKQCSSNIDGLIIGGQPAEH
jgi:hypothetical protein